MGIEERRERERQQRRQDILDAAETLFFTQGPDQTSMDQVAEAAELSKGTLYLYFKNKNDLTLGLSHRALTMLESRFKEAIAHHLTGQEQLAAVGQIYVDFAFEHPDHYRLMMQCATSHHTLTTVEPEAQACQETGLNIHRLTASAIRTGIQDGTIHTQQDPLELAILLWGQTTGVIQILKQNRDSLERKFNLDTLHLLELHFEMIRKGIQSNNE